MRLWSVLPICGKADLLCLCSTQREYWKGGIGPQCAVKLKAAVRPHRGLSLNFPTEDSPRFRPVDRPFSVFRSSGGQLAQRTESPRPEMVLRWRRHGIATVGKYRSRGRSRDGHPRVALKTRQLTREMAHSNFLWGAPRIHAALLKLGTTISQAVASRSVPPSRKKPSLTRRGGGGA